MSLAKTLVLSGASLAALGFAGCEQPKPEYQSVSTSKESQLVPAEPKCYDNIALYRGNTKVREFNNFSVQQFNPSRENPSVSLDTSIILYFTPKKETLGKLRGSKIVLTDTTEKKPFPWTGRYQFSISECK